MVGTASACVHVHSIIAAAAASQSLHAHRIALAEPKAVHFLPLTASVGLLCCLRAAFGRLPHCKPHAHEQHRCCRRCGRRHWMLGGQLQALLEELAAALWEGHCGPQGGGGQQGEHQHEQQHDRCSSKERERRELLLDGCLLAGWELAAASALAGCACCCGVSFFAVSLASVCSAPAVPSAGFRGGGDAARDGRETAPSTVDMSLQQLERWRAAL
eukprot:CAMPEP_0171211896 /NCGR_PEP_ID=MMETSP0790-20130122/29857_1 /TAXON_ID=2925 /ORGANISM="Alexandrium catenella, Strain OF101" /LENGTH=214 /DNA_ID=CAMNT_0011677571 /DNA_START=234 /DNA_END=879 /DNA_ORIENTATION=+